MTFRFSDVAALLCAGLIGGMALPATAAPPDEKRLEAVEKGVKYLVASLDRGKLGGNYYRFIRCNDHAIVGLALLAHGSGYESGPYHDRHPKLLDFLKNNRFGGKDRASYYMGVWGHGYMLWYASELAETASPEDRYEIDRFVLQLIKELTSWQSETGGWGHHPELVPATSGYREFAVITSLSLCSLLRARERGYFVEPEVIEKAFKYLDSTIKTRGGAPRYAARADIGAGGRREGAPRGALVMLPYAIDRRTTPPVRRLLKYLKQCEDFTGGHASAALGMCHSALLFSTINEYNYFWNLHGSSILERQKPDGSFTPLPPGARTDSERDGDLSNAFHTLTIALPEAPWRWREESIPATSYYSMRSVAERAVKVAKENDTYEFMKQLAELDPEDDPRNLSREITGLINRSRRETRDVDELPWLAEILDPYASGQVVAENDREIKILLAVSPVRLRGIRAEARILGPDGATALQTSSFRPEDKEMKMEVMTLRASEVDSIEDLQLQIEWSWRGKTFVTDHPLISPIDG